MSRPAAAPVGLIVAVSLAGLAHAAALAQDPASIADAARAAAAAAVDPARLAAPPQPQLAGLAHPVACSVPLRATASGYKPGATRVSVRVECGDPPVWRLWVPVSVEVRVPMVVVRHDLARDALLSAADLELVDRVPDGPGRWVQDPADLVGRRLRQPLSAGAPVQLGMTTADRLVVRGQRVTMTTNVGPLQVTAQGVALADGGLGARIRVRSLSSARMVEGVIRSSEVVEVLFPGGGSG